MKNIPEGYLGFICLPELITGELKRHVLQGAVLINGERVTPEESIDFPVFRLVFFPKSDKRRTTIV